MYTIIVTCRQYDLMAINPLDFHYDMLDIKSFYKMSLRKSLSIISWLKMYLKEKKGMETNVFIIARIKKLENDRQTTNYKDVP